MNVVRSIVAAGFCAVLLSRLAGAFSTNPGARVVHAKPGQTVDAWFDVIDNQDFPIDVTAEIRDSNILPENKGIQAKDWLKPQFTTLHVEPHSTVRAMFKAKPPKKASGELAAFISFSPESAVSKSPKGTPMGVRTEIVTLITDSLYLRIVGTEKSQVDLGEMRVDNLPVMGNLPARVQASVQVTNSGNIHQRPDGSISIMKKDSEKPEFVLSWSSGWPVMPYSASLYRSDAPGQLAAGDYVAWAKVDFNDAVIMQKKVGFVVTSLGATTNYVELP
jgi:hypothetical protein